MLCFFLYVIVAYELSEKFYFNGLQKNFKKVLPATDIGGIFISVAARTASQQLF
jgi:hypothetical protein